MKKQILSLLITLLALALPAQNWTWVRGNNIGGDVGKYGTMGVASATNDPGARHGCATWVDGLGNLWLFGGEGHASTSTTCWLNDMWKYDPQTNMWTWMRGSNGPNVQGVFGTQGVASAGNDPGAREFAAYWTDPQGNFWLFGGDGPISTTTTVASKMSDLWKFNPGTNQWTWMGGTTTFDQNGNYGTIGVQTSGTFPGGREGAVGWVDNNGKLWLFGGRGFSSTGTSPEFLNDLWRYDPTNGLWTWIHGSNLGSQTGTYGTLSTPGSGNTPGGRQYSGYWKHPGTGDLWLFGGLGYSSTNPGRNNDMWRYNVGSNMWTWMGGANVPNIYGQYGTLGVPSATNLPGSRQYPAGWVDAMGDFWIFGGFGYCSSTYSVPPAVPPSRLNDMFRYRPSTGEWTWMKGGAAVNIPGTYGTQGVAAPSNMPGARDYNDYWSITNQSVWLFGGEGWDSQGQGVDHMNDLWKFAPHCNPDSITTSNGLTMCNGGQATLTAYTQLPSSVTWHNVGFGGSAIGTGSAFPTPPLTAVSGPSVYTYFAEANSCTATPRTKVTITVNPLPQIQVSAPSSVCAGTSFTVSASGASTYTWNGVSTNASSFSVSAQSSSVYVAIGTQSSCTGSGSATVTVHALPSFTISSPAAVLCKGSTVTISSSGNYSFLWDNATSGPTISVSPTVTTAYTLAATNVTTGCNSAKTFTQTVSDCVGIGERLTSIEIFPNPSDGEITIKGTGNVAQLVVRNTIGQIVARKPVPENNTTVKLHLPSGLYLYAIESAGMVYTGRLIIE
jgi:N-acetylneuraminic acid mutarotase